MKKVICIDDKWETLQGPPVLSSPIFGEIVTITMAFRCGKYYWYTLMEYGNAEYEQSAFIPLSDIDEREIMKKRIGELDHKYEY